MALEKEVAKTATTTVQKESEGVFTDIRKTMNERLSNPFVFSFILSWITWNWMLIYDVFNFDKGLSLNNRVEIISRYINLHHWGNLLCWPLLSSACIAIGYILCSIVFITIFNFFNSTIKPQLSRITRRGDIIGLDTHILLEKKYDELELETTKYRRENLNVHTQYRDALQKAEDFSNKLTKEIEEHSKTKTELPALKAVLKNINEKLDKIELFHSKSILEISKFFNSRNVYTLSVNLNSQTSMSLNTVSAFKNPKKIRIEEFKIDNRRPSPTELEINPYANIYEITTNKLLYQMYNLKQAEENTVLRFELRPYITSNSRYIFYLFFENKPIQYGYVSIDGLFSPFELKREVDA